MVSACFSLTVCSNLPAKEDVPGSVLHLATFSHQLWPRRPYMVSCDFKQWSCPGPRCSGAGILLLSMSAVSGRF